MTSSTTFRILNYRPSAIWSWTKSGDQRAFGLASTSIGAWMPMARLRTTARAHPQPFLPVERVDAVNARGLCLQPQQDEQPSVAEPPALVGKVPQPLPDLRLGWPPGCIADHLAVGGKYAAGPALANLEVLSQIGDSLTLGGGPQHFLTADPSVSCCPAWH